VTGISKGYTFRCWESETTLETSLPTAAASLLPLPPAESAKNSGFCSFTSTYRLGLLVFDRCFHNTAIIHSVLPKATSPSPRSSRDSNLRHPHYFTLPLSPNLLGTSSACSLPGKVQAQLWRWLRPGTSPSQKVSSGQDLITLGVLYPIGPPNLPINFLHQVGAPGPRW